MRVAVVIPTWNRANLVRSILSNLREQERAPDQVLVVDNGSTDETVKVVHEFGVELLQLKTNRGFAIAVNEGIQAAQADWILILNNDVLLAPDWLLRALAAAEEAGVLFVVGKLLQAGGAKHLDGSWDLVSRAGYAWRCGYERSDGAAWSARRRIALAPMTAALFHRSVFERAGLLETRFESYYEDVDFGIRCALARIEGVYEPRAIATHLGKATFGKRAERVYLLSARNQLLLLAKHYPARTLRSFWWPILTGQVLALGAAAKQGHFWAAVRGKSQALRSWPKFRDALPPAAAIETITLQSEREIFELQRELGFDIYWRLYFTLVRSR